MLKPTKTLILIRHAHRDTTAREADNGLSEKGKKQAELLAKHHVRVFPARPALILTSPKRRCVETVTPIARKAKVEIQKSVALTEQGPKEAPQVFRLRIDEFCQWWRIEGPELAIVCSHGDWLPLCVETLTGGRVEFRKGGWAEIVLAGGRPMLRSLIQGFAEKGKGEGTSVAAPEKKRK